MSPASRRSPLAVICLTVFLDIAGFSIIFPLLPDMLEHYFEREGSEGLLGFLLGSESGGGLDVQDFRTRVLFGGILGSLYSALQFLSAPLWGSLSDRTGRRPVLLATIAGLALSYVLWFFSGTFLLLVLARCLGGAMSGNIAVASAVIVDVTDEKERAKGMGFLGAALGLGFFIGPALGSLLCLVDLGKITGGALGINPFSSAAAGSFLLAAINWIWVRKRFQETLSAEHRDRARHAGRPIHPLKLVRRYEYAGVNRTNLVYFLFFLAFAGMEFTLTFLAKERFDYTRTSMAWIFVYVGFIIILVQGGVIRRVVPRYGERRVALTGLILLPPGFLLTGWAEGGTLAHILFYSGLTFLALGSALTTPSLTSLVSLYSPADRRGEIQGVFRSLGALARAIGPITACALYFRFGAAALYTAGAIMLLLPALVARALPPPPEPAPAADAAAVD
ncbi:MAG: MFS transporter [Planctomycetota bacterium]|nr:MFS transporter [Planctomycetota bacterium]